MSELFAPYAHAIAAMAGMGLMVLILAPITGRMKAKLGLAPGAEPEADYANAAYRWHRAYGNAAESAGSFALVTLAAILAGASPVWVNWLASLFFLARLVLVVVHAGGFGRADMSLRSYVYIFGWLLCIILGLMAIIAVV
ncbi:MAPEG family protein [Roseovarius sp. C7]|uniref:MAPEG family protein n=1 Tax=Roseovarius sp. C7 TaxID=3398643 RepID=UPI0039F5826E